MPFCEVSFWEGYVLKRTAEIVLAVIGLLFTLIGAGFTTFITSLTRLDAFQEGFQEGYYEDLPPGTYESGEAMFVLNILSGFGWLIVAVYVIGAILGVISLIFFIGNKKPKPASIIMIVAALLVGIGTLITGFVPALLYLIAGIVGLVRKDPPVNEEESTVSV